MMVARPPHATVDGQFLPSYHFRPGWDFSGPAFSAGAEGNGKTLAKGLRKSSFFNNLRFSAWQDPCQRLASVEISAALYRNSSAGHPSSLTALLAMAPALSASALWTSAAGCCVRRCKAHREPARRPSPATCRCPMDAAHSSRAPSLRKGPRAGWRSRSMTDRRPGLPAARWPPAAGRRARGRHATSVRRTPERC